MNSLPSPATRPPSNSYALTAPVERRGEEPSAAVGEPDAREGLGLGLAAVTAGPREGELLVEHEVLAVELL